MVEYVKKADVLEIINSPLPRDLTAEYIYELKGVWLDEDEADAPKTKRSIEADKVVEALKICDHNSDGESCKTCTYRDAKWDGAWESEDGEWCCYKQLASDAISLIEQTERSE